MAKIGRNEACSCGSGKKYKQCCESKGSSPGSRMLLVLVAVLFVAAVLALISNRRADGGGGGGVWSQEHGHYHDASGREVPR